MEPWTDGPPQIFKSELSYGALPSAHGAEGKYWIRKEHTPIR